MWNWVILLFFSELQKVSWFLIKSILIKFHYQVDSVPVEILYSVVYATDKCVETDINLVNDVPPVTVSSRDQDFG